MKTHELKLWPRWFEAVAEGRKRAEYRVGDRDYAEGDVLRLREYVPRNLPMRREAYYTGRELWARVTHLTIADAGHVVLSIQTFDPEDTAGDMFMPGQKSDQVDVLARAAAYLSPRQVQQLRGRLAELASAQAGRMGRRR